MRSLFLFLFLFVACSNSPVEPDNMPLSISISGPSSGSPGETIVHNQTFSGESVDYIADYYVDTITSGVFSISFGSFFLSGTEIIRPLNITIPTGEPPGTYNYTLSWRDSSLDPDGDNPHVITRSITILPLPAASAPTSFNIDPVSEIGHNEIITLRARRSGGVYDGTDHDWFIDSGPGNLIQTGNTATYYYGGQGPSVRTGVTVRCRLTVHGNGNNAADDTEAQVSDTESFWVNARPSDDDVQIGTENASEVHVGLDEVDEIHVGTERII